jgi:agmatine deiminase
MKRPLIFVSDLLPKRRPDVARAMLRAVGGNLRTIRGAKDIWCSDYMPVATGDHRFVQFRYAPDYLRRYPNLRTAHGAALVKLRNCTHSQLIIDGGNIVRRGDTAILTNKVFAENAREQPLELMKKLKELLKVDRLIFIPVEPGDVCGHSDGVLAFIDDRTLLVNDYTRASRSYGKRLSSLLHHHGFGLVPFPYRPSDEIVNGMPSAEGVYINFLQTHDKVLLPIYGEREDDQAMRTLERVMNKDVVPIRCNRLAREGGVLHCVTWELTADYADIADNAIPPSDLSAPSV